MNDLFPFLPFCNGKDVEGGEGTVTMWDGIRWINMKNLWKIEGSTGK
jgi:hypothetical protein